MRKLLALFVLLFPLLALALDEPMQPEKAFRLSAAVLDAKTVEVRFDIADEYYLYRDKFKFAVEPAQARLGEARFPAGKMKQDDFFGQVETYYKQVRIALPVEAPPGVTKLELTVTSQGCWDQGVCYPPLPQRATVELAGMSSSAPPGAPAGSADLGAGLPGGGDESSQIARMMRGGGFWLITASFFGFGLLLAFTPCVFPMIPILSGIIVGHGHKITKTHALVLSLAYVLGMAATYAAAGVAAGLSGTLLSAALQNPWVLGSFALVFVLLSLSMFGFYELQMPAALQTRLSESANRRGGSLAGVTAMGALSAIIVGPCVAAPLAGALLYIAQTGDAVLGGAALFSLALGMGAPLILVGVSARSFLPKAGGWMEAVKKFFGVALLAVAIWLVTPVIPAIAAMLAWAALLILSAIYLHALDPLPANAHGWQRFWKGIGVVSLLVGAALLIGALAGSRDPLQPLAILRGAVAAPESHLKFERVKTVEELDARLQQANRTVMLDFYADWCVSCKEMERFTFADPAVKVRLDRMMLLQADVTANSEADKALLKRFGLFGPPGIIFFDARGQEIADLRVVGYQPAERFGPLLDRALQGGGGVQTSAPAALARRE
jgi:thiol:disulfide interchange protein DsbD